MRRAIGGSRPTGSYTPGIVATGSFIYVSGQGPIVDGVVTGETIEEQTEITLTNLQAVLREAGLSLQDVVKCAVFHSDINDFDRMDATYRRWFDDPRPARTTVAVGLAGIMIEIDCVAVRDAEQR